MNSKKKSKSTSSTKDVSVKKMRKALANALAPCYEDPPAAAAILIVTNNEGTKHFSLNMEPMEVAHILVTAGIEISQRLSPHPVPRTPQ